MIKYVRWVSILIKTSKKLLSLHKTLFTKAKYMAKLNPLHFWLQFNWSPINNLSKFGSLSCILITYIETAIIFVSSIKMISK